MPAKGTSFQLLFGRCGVIPFHALSVHTMKSLVDESC
jgi:hypothetical protein